MTNMNLNICKAVKQGLIILYLRVLDKGKNADKLDDNYAFGGGFLFFRCQSLFSLSFSRNSGWTLYPNVFAFCVSSQALS